LNNGEVSVRSAMHVLASMSLAPNVWSAAAKVRRKVRTEMFMEAAPCVN